MRSGPFAFFAFSATPVALLVSLLILLGGSGGQPAYAHGVVDQFYTGGQAYNAQAITDLDFVTYVAAPIPTPTPSATPSSTPTPTPTSEGPWPTIPDRFYIGDFDCNDRVDVHDVLATLSALAGVLPGANCAAFSDVDCDGDLGADDALRILDFVASVPLPQPTNCPGVGTLT